MAFKLDGSSLIHDHKIIRDHCGYHEVETMGLMRYNVLTTWQILVMYTVSVRQRKNKTWQFK